jgi:hypothetical protein
VALQPKTCAAFYQQKTVTVRRNGLPCRYCINSVVPGEALRQAKQDYVQRVKQDNENICNV